MQQKWVLMVNDVYSEYYMKEKGVTLQQAFGFYISQKSGKIYKYWAGNVGQYGQTSSE